MLPAESGGRRPSVGPRSQENFTTSPGVNPLAVAELVFPSFTREVESPKLDCGSGALGGWPRMKPTGVTVRTTLPYTMVSLGATTSARTEFC